MRVSSHRRARLPRGLVPLLLVSGVVLVVTLGLARGVWLPNLHNGLLALAFTLVGAYAVYPALWAVEYAAAGVTTAYPFATSTPSAVTTVWSALAHPAYAFFQLLWPVAIGLRWRSASGLVRRQLAWLLLAAAAAAVALATGLLGWRSPRPGVLAAALLPVAAGLAIVHGQRAAAYAALTWMSRRGPGTDDLPSDLAWATSEALSAPATLWLGSEELYAVGVWPPSPDDPSPSPLSSPASLSPRSPADLEGRVWLAASTTAVPGSAP